MTDIAKVNPRDMWLLLINSVRYSMGRQTSAVADTCEIVRRHYKSLEGWQIAQIAREIREELDRAERKLVYRNGFLGAECDHKDWTALAEFLEAK
jgi:hypothetical protein